LVSESFPPNIQQSLTSEYRNLTRPGGKEVMDPSRTRKWTEVADLIMEKGEE
jgi:hypothetical protein